MKKIFSFAAMALTLALAGCSKGYSVSGTIEGAEDGDTVRIIALTGGELDTLHTTTVKDGKFSISGEADSIVYALIAYDGAGDRHNSGGFFLENGNIHIDMKEGEPLPEVSGTLINERTTELTKKGYALNEEIQDAVMGYSEEMSDEEKAEVEAKMEELNGKMETLYKQFIQDNIQNFAGQFYLANFAANFDEDFVKEQLAAIPGNAETYVVRELKKVMQKMEETSVGAPFVDFKAETPEGETLAVSDVAKEAKVLMVDFWASWCGPCRGEMPNVKAAYERFHDQGFEIIGVSLDSNAQDWKNAIGELGMTWLQISDLKGWDSEGAKLYSVQAIPATVLIKDGKIVARDVRGEALSPQIEKLLE